MAQPIFNRMEIGVIRFTRRITRQCLRPESRVPDWAICDAIANGDHRRLGRRGTRGGALIQFERTFPGARGSAGATVRVLGELTRKGCFALHLLPPFAVRKKISDKSGFLNRAFSK